MNWEQRQLAAESRSGVRLKAEQAMAAATE